MDCTLARLALFLDPRYKNVVCTSQAQLTELKQQVGA
jgi:hypothetical protein